MDYVNATFGLGRSELDCVLFMKRSPSRSGAHVLALPRSERSSEPINRGSFKRKSVIDVVCWKATIERARKLPESEQDAIAALILERIQADVSATWDVEVRRDDRGSMGSDLLAEVREDIDKLNGDHPARECPAAGPIHRNEIRSSGLGISCMLRPAARDGIVDKPRGLTPYGGLILDRPRSTSNDASQQFERHVLGPSRAGHTGALGFWEARHGHAGFGSARTPSMTPVAGPPLNNVDTKATPRIVREPRRGPHLASALHLEGRRSGWLVLAASIAATMLGAGPAGAEAAQHRLHLQRRPRLPGHRRLRRPPQARRDAEHRPDRPRGDAVRPLRGAQLDLRAEPGDDPDRQVLAHQRLLQQHQQPVRRLAADLPQDAPGRRLPDGRHRQVAPRHRPHRLRRVAHPAGPGGLLQPADDPQRPARQA